MSDAIDRSGAAEFEDEDVVLAYVHRPAYPDALISRLLELMPQRGRALDLGCGPGKIARAISHHVQEVVAVDPSAAMLRFARDLDGDRSRNIRWIQGRGEDLDLDGPVHLAVAGAAIHWMDPALLFPNLARLLAPRAPVAVVDGDEPTAAPWIGVYRAFIVDWVGRLGGHWNDQAHRARMDAHETWIDIQGRETFIRQVVQPLNEFIECQHSRATWARRRMGVLAAEFDAELADALAPWANGKLVEFEMETRLVWGRTQAPPHRQL